MIHYLIHPSFTSKSHFLIFMEKLIIIYRSFKSCRFLDTYLINDVLSLLTEFNMRVLNRIWKSHWELGNDLIHCVLVSMVKWRDSNNHLVNQDTNTPPIYWFIMSFPSYNFRGQILGRATKRLSKTFIANHFSKTEICKAKEAYIK